MSRENQVRIRKAIEKDIDKIKLIADANKDTIGFVLRSQFEAALNRSELLVATTRNGIVIGFANYHHRKDAQTTLYEICVKEEHRGNGIGRKLIRALVEESKDVGKKKILLKCPESLEANGFYRKLCFENIAKENGRKRRLNVWALDLNFKEPGKEVK